MPNTDRSRRAFLTAVAGGATLLGSAGLGTAAVDPGGGTGTEIRQSSILPNQRQETSLHTVDAAADGPTALVVGGLQGGETAGVRAAKNLVAGGTEIDAGTLAVIPRANAVAIERSTYAGLGGNLNRLFPIGDRPESELARALWRMVESVDPDLVVDLHSSRGVYHRSPDGVGQAVFHSHGDRAAARTEDVVREVNRAFDLPPNREFRSEPIHFTPSSPSGMLVEKTSRDLGAESYLAEVYRGFSLDGRIAQLEAVARELLDEADLLNVP